MTAAIVALLALAVGILAGFHVGRVYQARQTRRFLAQMPPIVRSFGVYEGRQR